MGVKKIERDKKRHLTSLDRNRRRLADQVGKMDDWFTEDELFELHKENCYQAGEEDFIFDGVQTVGNFLDLLRDIEVLEKDVDRYRVRKPYVKTT